MHLFSRLLYKQRKLCILAATAVASADLLVPRHVEPTPMLDAWTSRLSVAEVSTFRWSFEEDVLRYRSHGFDAMGVWRMKLADYGEAKGADFLEENGMQVSSLSWAGGFTGNDGRSFREALHDALDAIETAAQIKAKTLVILTGSRMGHTRNHAKRMLTLALRELTEAARAVGVHSQSSLCTLGAHKTLLF